MTQNVTAVQSQRVTLSDRLLLEPSQSAAEWIIRDRETGDRVGQLNQPENSKVVVELFWGKGGFMAVLNTDETHGGVYFGLPGSEIEVGDTRLVLDGDQLLSGPQATTAVSETLAAPYDSDSVQTHTSQAMILGAGLATRFERISGHSTDYSKPAVPLLGRHSVIGCLARHLAQHGFSRLFVNTYFKPESLKASLAECSVVGPAPDDIRYIDEAKPSGTAGALRKLLTEAEFKGWLDTDKPLIVAQGDSVTDADFSELMNAHVAQNALVTMGCQLVADEDVDKFGILVLCFFSKSVPAHSRHLQ
jgi:hypothetical protein